MSSFRVTPSTAYTVRPDTPIADCIRVMRDRGFGSVLVADSNRGLIGIFTERDLLKWIDEIQHGGHWNKPIAVLMSKPVITLPLAELEHAAELMIERNIRHLPIVHGEPGAEPALIGVISMRDLLRDMVATERTAAFGRKRVRVGMIAQSDSMRHLFRKICTRRGNAIAESISIDDEAFSPSAMGELDFLLFDLDGIETSRWISILKELNASPHGDVLLFYDPEKYSEATLEALSKLSLSKRFSAFMKPVNLFTVLARMP